MDDDIREIAVSIWETLFSLPLETEVEMASPDDPVVTGCISIDGAWNGAVTLQCGERLADVLAGQLFRSPSPSPDEVRDAIGEITNMLAGNIKALVAEPSRISLPTVVFGGDYALTVRGTKPVSAVPFRCDGSALVVTLLEQAADDAR